MAKLADVENVMVGVWGSTQNPMIDPGVKTLVAGTNAFQYPITFTDATVVAVVTITPPYPSFSGPIYVIPGAAFTWTAAGNIATTGTAVVGKVIIFVYSPSTGKWYASI